MGRAALTRIFASTKAAHCAANRRGTPAVRCTQRQWRGCVVTANKTESETYFEAFCRRNGIELLPVPVGADKTPDYTLTIRDSLIVVEVKQVEPAADELESDRLVAERGYGNVISRTPGKMVRRKIADCAPQIRARTHGKYPGLLVLWERGHCAGRHTEPYHITVAMEGFEQMVLTVPPLGSGESPSVVGMKHGGSRKMTPDANTSISAVALLCAPGPGRMLLQVFHNRHAAVPLDPALLKSPEVVHYAARVQPPQRTEWIEITSLELKAPTQRRIPRWTVAVFVLVVALIIWSAIGRTPAN